jgi:hypothetical protein
VNGVASGAPMTSQNNVETALSAIQQAMVATACDFTTSQSEDSFVRSLTNPEFCDLSSATELQAAIDEAKFEETSIEPAWYGIVGINASTDAPSARLDVPNEFWTMGVGVVAGALVGFLCCVWGVMLRRQAMLRTVHQPAPTVELQTATVISPRRANSFRPQYFGPELALVKFQRIVRSKLIKKGGKSSPYMIRLHARHLSERLLFEGGLSRGFFRLVNQLCIFVFLLLALNYSVDPSVQRGIYNNLRLCLPTHSNVHEVCWVRPHL